ncbi:MAG: nucleotide exchange factor GrpE [Bacillota bacterium]|nr:MAG: nucleotide exchange factor GrpE [Bacillota bacterium]
MSWHPCCAHATRDFCCSKVLINVSKLHAHQSPPADDQARDAGVPEEERPAEAEAEAPAEAPRGEPDGNDAEDEAALKQRIEELEALNRELSDRYVRLLADFDNFRRRTRQNEEAVRATAAEALIVDLLPVLDHLQMALAAAGDALEGPFGQGVKLIHQQLHDVLARHGLQAVEAQGRPFDPNTMEAVARAEPDENTPDGFVVEEYRRGYQLHGKLLRASQVKVAQAE